VIEVASWRDSVDAILLAWQPGQEGGHAIADLLRGSVSPSGRLATTFPTRYEDVASAKNFPGRVIPGAKPLVDSPFAGVPARVVYEEGLFVGYRHHDSFAVAPAYEFGFGLSYATFEFGEMAVGAPDAKGDRIVTTTITNTGRTACRAVPQLYVAPPAGARVRPAQELKAFAKTKLLEPGESQPVSLLLRPADLASFDPATSSWVADAGSYELRLGASSRDIKRTASVRLPRAVVVQKAHRALAPRAPIEEIRPKAR
jgi:beta-glucosidase